MRKLIIAVLVLVSVFVIASNYDEAYQYAYKAAELYGISVSRAKLLAKTVAEEYERFPQVPYQVFVALIVSESSFKNLYGDGGDAVGYCQLHKSAVWYVANFFPEIKERVKKIEHDDLIKFPELQIRIGYRYLYLILRYITDWNIVRALNYWNNSNKYYQRVFYIVDYLAQNVGGA